MDEDRFKTAYGIHSFFFLSLDQKDALTGLRRSSQERQTVSKDHVTHIHLVIQHNRHFAAVQISIIPFSIPRFPRQNFYSSTFRYSLCCQSSAEAGLSTDLISTVVQKIYDIHYQPSEWDFSDNDW